MVRVRVRVRVSFGIINLTFDKKTRLAHLGVRIAYMLPGTNTGSFKPSKMFYCVQLMGIGLITGSETDSLHNAAQ